MFLGGTVFQSGINPEVADFLFLIDVVYHVKNNIAVTAAADTAKRCVGTGENADCLGVAVNNGKILGIEDSNAFDILQPSQNMCNHVHRPAIADTLVPLGIADPCGVVVG